MDGHCSTQPDREIEEKYCKHCRKSVKTSWDCQSCTASYHPSCAKQAKVVKLEENSTAVVNCCNQANPIKKTEKASTEMDEKKIRAIMEELFKEHLNSFKKTMEKEFVELKKSVQYISDGFDEQKREIDALIQETKQLSTEKMAMTARIDELESRLNEFEKQARSKNVIIGGIPKQNIGLIEVVHQVARSMNIKLEPDSISEVYRLGKQETAPLVVKMNNPDIKNKFFLKVKEMKGINTQQCGLHGNNKIFINEDLTSRNQKLLKKTLEEKRMKKFYSVYTRNGRVFLKKTKDEAPRRILSDDDLNKAIK